MARTMTTPFDTMTTPFDELAGVPRWVAWRNEPRGTKGKPTKVPYSPHRGRARANDPKTWGTRAAAETMAKLLVNGLGGGVGFELGDLGHDHHVAGLDLDSCLDEEGRLAEWAAAILDAAPSYAEISPSGTGIKIFFYVESSEVRPFLDRIGVEAGKWGTRRGVPGHDGRDHGPAIEIYFSHHFFAVTDNQWTEAPDRLLMLEADDLKRLAPLIPPPRQPNGTAEGGDDSRSAKAFRKGVALRRADKTFEQMVEALQEDPETADWVDEKGLPNGMRELHRIWDKAEAGGVTLDDFRAYMPQHSYLFRPTRETWPSRSLDARIPPIRLTDASGAPILDETGKQKTVPASVWLDRYRPIEQMTWAPGEPEIIEDRLVSDGGWIARQGVHCYNLYRPPAIEPGDHAKAGPWLDHISEIFPDDVDHIVKWLASRRQQPEDKINHALVLGGRQGIGKDSLLEPAKFAVGPWNFKEISPKQLLGRFNPFIKSVVLRISEARDLGDIDRYQLYEHLKVYTASPPDVLTCDEKNIREHAVFNCTGVIVTTNHKTNGIYLPPDDRRHYVAWSEREKTHFSEAYWQGLWSWYAQGGIAHVVAYFDKVDLRDFNPKAPPPQTRAFWEIVDSSRPVEDAELADALDRLGSPPVVTISRIAAQATVSFRDWLLDRRNARQVPHRFEECGYVAVRNDAATSGLWVIDGRRQVVTEEPSFPNVSASRPPPNFADPYTECSEYSDPLYRLFHLTTFPNK
jgi:hypothetical protein